MYFTYRNAKGEQATARIEWSVYEGQSVVTKPKLCYLGRLGSDAVAASSTEEMELIYVKRGRRWEEVEIEDGKIGSEARRMIERDALNQ